VFSRTLPMTKHIYKATSAGVPWVFFTSYIPILLTNVKMDITTDATAGNRWVYSMIWNASFSTLQYRWVTETQIPASTTATINWGQWPSTPLTNGVMYAPMHPCWVPEGYNPEGGDWNAISAGDVITVTFTYYSLNGEAAA